MTLNLPEREMEILDAMCAKKDMSKTALIRQALRIYQLVDSRLSIGDKIVWRRPDGSFQETEIIIGYGCPPLD